MLAISYSWWISGYALLDLGARYQFNLEKHSTTLRMQVLDVTNTLSWGVASDGGLSRWLGDGFGLISLLTGRRRLTITRGSFIQESMMRR